MTPNLNCLVRVGGLDDITSFIEKIHAVTPLLNLLVKAAQIRSRWVMFLCSFNKKLYLIITALDKREYLVIKRDNFCYFCIKTNVVTPHLNHLNEMVQMRSNNIGFNEK